jgi:hypothetical protein
VALSDLAIFWNLLFLDGEGSFGASWHALVDALYELAQFICKRTDPCVFAGSFDKVSKFLHLTDDRIRDVLVGSGDGIGCMVCLCGVAMVLG